MILNENILQLTTGCHQGAHEQHREGFHCCVDLRLTCVCVCEVWYPHFISRTAEGVGAAKHTTRTIRKTDSHQKHAPTTGQEAYGPFVVATSHNETSSHDISYFLHKTNRPVLSWCAMMLHYLCILQEKQSQDFNLHIYIKHKSWHEWLYESLWLTH